MKVFLFTRCMCNCRELKSRIMMCKKNNAKTVLVGKLELDVDVNQYLDRLNSTFQ